MKMEESMVPAVTAALNRHLESYKVHICFNENEVRHFFMPKEQVIYSWVVYDQASGEVSDFISFYALNSQVLQDDKHDMIYAAYAYYNFVKGNDPERMKQLMRDALILAKQHNFDVFNMTEVLQHGLVKNDLLFKPGDGKLSHYLYNWRISAINPNDIGIVLV